MSHNRSLGIKEGKTHPFVLVTVWTSLEDIPGFSVGYDNDGSGKGGGGNGKDDYERERYHLATRQLSVLEHIFDELTKIRERAYGTNILEAIERQIDATQKLLDREKELREEA